MEYIQMHKKAMMLSSRIVDESQAESAQTAAGDSSVTEIAAAQDEDDDDDDLGDAYIISSSSSATNGAASSINGSGATSSGLYFISIWIWGISSLCMYSNYDMVCSSGRCERRCDTAHRVVDSSGGLLRCPGRPRGEVRNR